MLSVQQRSVNVRYNCGMKWWRIYWFCVPNSENFPLLSPKGDNKRKFSKRSQIFFPVKMEIFQKTLLRYISNRRAHEMRNIPYIGVCNFLCHVIVIIKQLKNMDIVGKKVCNIFAVKFPYMNAVKGEKSMTWDLQGSIFAKPFLENDLSCSCSLVYIIILVRAFSKTFLKRRHFVFSEQKCN